MNRRCDRTSDARAASAGALPGCRAGLSFVLAVGLLALCAASCHSAEAAGAVRLAKFTVVADVHFDPFFDAALVDRLAAAELREWPRIFESRPSGFSPYGTDANYRLLASVLQDARTRAPRPDFIFYPGDFLAHRWRTRFDALSGDRSERAYRAFTAKVIQFLAQQFGRHFPACQCCPRSAMKTPIAATTRFSPEARFSRCLPRHGGLFSDQRRRAEATSGKSFQEEAIFRCRCPARRHTAWSFSTRSFSRPDTGTGAGIRRKTLGGSSSHGSDER